MATINVGTLEAILRLNDQMTPGLKKTIAQMKDAVVAFGSLAAAVGIASKALEAQAQQEAAINRLNLALANQGKLTDGTSKALIEYSEALQSTSTFADDVILSSEAMLASFGLTEEQIVRTTQAAADYAAATGTDLATATQMLAKASTGNITALQKQGFEFDKTATDAEKFEAALAQVEGRFGGSALAATQNFTGQMEQLRNAFDDTMEGLGKFLGELVNFGTVGGGAVGMLKSLSDFFAVDMVIALGEARALFAEFAATVLEMAAKVGPIFEKLGLIPKGNTETIKIMASGLRDFADEVRQQSTDAALAAGNVQTYTNAVGGTIPANDEAAKAAARHAEEIKKLAESLTGVDLAKSAANMAEALGGAGIMDKVVGDGTLLTNAHEQVQQFIEGGLKQLPPALQEIESAWAALDPTIREGAEGMRKFFEESAQLAKENTEQINASFDAMGEQIATTFNDKVKAALDLGETFGQFQGEIDKLAGAFGFMESSLGGLGAQTTSGLQKMGEQLAKAADEAPELAEALAKVNAEIAKRGGKPILSTDELAAAAEKIHQMEMAFQSLAQLAGLFGDKLGAGVGIIGEMVIAMEKGADKFETIAMAVAKLGNVIGGKLGGALEGGASGAMAGSAISKALGFAGPAGAIIGGALGFIGGIFGNAKKKAEELKRKQEEAMDAFSSAFDQWKQAGQELAAKGAEGATSLIDTLFKDGKFTAEFTSAANAAEYVVGAFNALRASGLSFSQALAKIGPALTAMGKDAKQFAGTAAAPLIAMAKIAGENEKLLQFQAGLADVAVGLAAFNQLTQETATKMSIDMGASIDKLVAKGATYEQALGISAESLFKLQSAAQKGGVTLDAHTQKMIDDAQAAGLFDGLQDPMQKLIQATQAVVAAIGTMVQLLGGQVPAAVQRMIDEFNNAQINVNVNVNQTGPTQIEGGPPGPPTEIEHFQRGGFAPELPRYPHGYAVMVGEHGTGGEDIVPRRGGSMHDGGGDTYVTNVYAMPHQDERQIAEEANRLVRLNKRGRLTQARLGHR